jgi:xanthine dehydrogenase accessory factor
VGNNSSIVEEAARDAVSAWDGKQLRQVFGPAWRVLLIGAGQLSRYTAEFALALDFEVIVCEPRPEFRKTWAVDAATLIDTLPDTAVLEFATDPQSAVLALTHDPNLDDLALMEALPGHAFYVGALGSTRNYERRCKRLAAVGLPASAIARLRGPVGLAIGSRTSAEIAVSIAAELVQLRHEVLGSCG